MTRDPGPHTHGRRRARMIPSGTEGRLCMNPCDDRLYAATLRAAAVAQVRAGQSVQVVAETLHIPVEALADWLRDLRDDDAKGERTSYTVDTAEQRELRRLRLENDYLRQ